MRYQSAKSTVVVVLTGARREGSEDLKQMRGGSI
jgi:chemotaxis response regulator CheB